MMGPRSILTSAVAIIAFAVATRCEASMVFDSFETYAPNTSLNGQNGGIGWTTPWTAAGASIVVDAIPDMTAANGQYGGDQALRFTTDSHDAAFRRFSALSGDVYASFLFRYDAGAIGNNDFLGLWFDNSATGGSPHTDVPNFGLKAQEGPSSSDYFLRLTGTGGSFVTTPQAAIGNTVQIVARLYKESSTTYNRMQLWVNPTNATNPTPLTISGATSLSAISRIGFRIANLDAGDRLLVDNVAIGTTFDSVMINVPEPATMALVALTVPFGVGLRFARRRQPSAE